MQPSEATTHSPSDWGEATVMSLSLYTSVPRSVGASDSSVNPLGRGGGAKRTLATSVSVCVDGDAEGSLPTRLEAPGREGR